MSEITIKDISKIPFFYDIKSEDLSFLQETLCLREVENNRYVYKEGDESIAMYFILEGSVKVKKKNSSNEEDLIAELYSPAIFGENSLIDNARYPQSIIATSNLKLAQLKVENFERIIESKPEIAVHLIRKIAHSLNLRLSAMQRV